jgi:adenylyltransferase/sulfurtransferase
MAVRILIPTPLRTYTNRQASVTLDGATVGELLARLAEAHTDLRHHLYREDGGLRNFVNVYVNDDDIRHLQGVETPVSASDIVSIVPSVAGGVSAELPSLAPEEYTRYSRHLILPEVGLDGQRKLKAARVLCVGAGGLGSPAALYLAAAGVGTIGLVDFDTVDISNLQRQILYDTTSVGQPKLLSAAARLTALNPHVRIVTHDTALKSSNALGIINGYDIVIDGADNFPARYLVNDACVLLGKPNVHGSIFRFDGQASIFAAPGGPCYRCLYPEPPPPGLVPSCAEGGVLGVLPGLVGTIQAAEAIKWILGIGEPLVGRLLLIDALTMGTRLLKTRRNAECPVCGDAPSIRELIDYEQFCGISPAPEPRGDDVSVEELKAAIDRRDPVWLVDVREPHEAEICRIPGARLVPLGQLPARLGELPAGPGAPEIIVHCKMGGRSAKAAAVLKSHGFERVRNLEGGILAWIDRIDPSQPRY